MRFEIDVISWIPMPEVPNPIFLLPGGTTRWGSGACGSHFGGDNFAMPPSTAVALIGTAAYTFRARQNVTFDAKPWGTVSGLRTSGVIPGITTVLTGARVDGGRVCHNMTATVLRSAATVSFDASSEWYEIVMQGKAQDPIPTAVGRHVAGPTGATGGTILTPALEWDLTMRLSTGSMLGFWTTQRYRADAPLGFDDSASLPGVSATLGGGTTHLLHGIISVRRFPSYVVYVTLTSATGTRSTEIVFFADASHRGLVEIVLPWDSQLRRITF